MQRTLLLAVVFAVSSTTVWTSRVTGSRLADKEASFPGTLASDAGFTSGRTLKDEYEDEERSRDGEGERRRGDDGDDESSGRNPPLKRRPGGQPQRPRSFSRTRMRGVLRVVVRGNGESCFVKIFQRGITYDEQFGDSTTASAFINLFGHGECEPGAKGRAVGFAKACVFAEAHAIGSICESKVMTEVITRTRDLDPNDGVNVIVEAAAGGEALAVCD